MTNIIIALSGPWAQTHILDASLVQKGARSHVDLCRDLTHSQASLTGLCVISALYQHVRVAARQSPGAPGSSKQEGNSALTTQREQKSSFCQRGSLSRREPDAPLTACPGPCSSPLLQHAAGAGGRILSWGDTACTTPRRPAQPPPGSSAPCTPNKLNGNQAESK